MRIINQSLGIKGRGVYILSDNGTCIMHILYTCFECLLVDLPNAYVRGVFCMGLS